MGFYEVDDARPVRSDGVDGFLEREDATVFSLFAPVLEEKLGLCRAVELPELPEQGLQAVALADFRVQPEQFGQLGLPFVAQLDRVRQQRVLVPFQVLALLLLQPAQLVEGLVDLFHDVEAVKGDPGVREKVAHPADEGGGHVDADLPDLFRWAAVCAEVVGKTPNGSGVLARHDLEHPFSG